MTTVTQGTTGTYTFSANEYALITVNPGNQADVIVKTASGVREFGSSLSTTRAIGPFNATDVMSLSALRGSIDYTIATYTPPVTGGGAVASVAGKTGTVTLAATDVGAVGLPASWAAATNTPALTSGTAVLGTAFNNTSPGVTTLGTPIDGISILNQGDKLICFTAGTYTLVPANNILPPRTLGSTYTLVDTDNGVVFNTPVNCVVTVNAGLGAGFGCGFMGAGVVTFAGAAAPTDNRKTGSTAPFCGLVCSAADTYQARGEKA